jgi:hypothetical protein
MDQHEWENKFVKFSHILLEELNLVDKLFMLTSVSTELKQVSCHCFYATVVFTPNIVAVFYNDAGGMCPPTMENLVKYYKNTVITVDVDSLKNEIENSKNQERNKT